MTRAYRYHGRDFTDDDLQIIRGLCTDEAYPTRAAIARAVCEVLDWRRLDGRRKDMAARIALLRMADDGLIVLPAPSRGNGNGQVPRYTDPEVQLALDLATAGPALPASTASATSPWPSSTPPPPPNVGDT